MGTELLDFSRLIMIANTQIDCMYVNFGLCNLDNDLGILDSHGDQVAG